MFLCHQHVFYYPDVMVTCDPTDADPLFRKSPKLIIEVLSENKKKDLIEKAAVYPAIESLEEYVTVDPNPEAPEVRISRRSNGWDPVEVVQGLDSEFTLHSVSLTLKVSDLFAV